MTGYKIGMIHTSCLNEDGCNYKSCRYTNVKDVASTSQITRKWFIARAFLNVAQLFNVNFNNGMLWSLVKEEGGDKSLSFDLSEAMVFEKSLRRLFLQQHNTSQCDFCFDCLSSLKTTVSGVFATSSTLHQGKDELCITQYKLAKILF